MAVLSKVAAKGFVMMPVVNVELSSGCETPVLMDERAGKGVIVYAAIISQGERRREGGGHSGRQARSAPVSSPS